MREIIRGLQRVIDSAGSAPLPRSRGSKSTPADSVVPFLKWAGGKRWLAPLAVDLRSLRFDRYFEPFLGSGAMFFGIAPATSVLSDSNADLIDAYCAIKGDWRAVARKLREHDRNHCEDYYYLIRSQAPLKPHTRAARFIYLNRTCWNGLYRVNKLGVFNTPIGTKTRAVLDSDDFERVANRLKSAKLIAADFEHQIDMAQEGDLVFADPPYTVRHQYNGFVKYNEKLFSWSDQERLCEALWRASKRGAAIICTNADHESVRQLYGPYFNLTPRQRFSAIAGNGGARGQYAELIISG
ncbi:Dam family site-specific DNA-(adenine-N6)-methyltransferase [Lysobacter sp. Root604]|uniref:DNA adenine methylase n=1 Tax=Lysobacter sp. Root604 TaxID=1736568 RepID=UPI0009E9B5DA|nr:Dam family site-specific DNA-(adenine-N6)-methyltransferase [Lysobacter sp. Root604]